MGCGSSGQNTVVQQSSPPPQVLNDYQNLINQGQAVAQLPLQQYSGPVIAGFNPTQQAAFSEVNQAQGSALPYLNAAQSYLAAGAQPVMNQVQGFNALGQYENPYTQAVTQATENLLNNQNAQQFNSANAAAASAGAFGGDRESVLEAQMAGQQQLSEAPTLANIQSQGFTGAEQELNAQQNLQLQGAEGSGWLGENAVGLESGLGTTAQNSLLSGASAELQTGGLQQQLQQEELGVPEAYFNQQQQFPYATTNFLAGLIEGAAPGEGGTSSTTLPGPSVLGQVTGLGMTGLGAYGLANNAGLFGSGASTAATAGLLDSSAMSDLTAEAGYNIAAGAAGLRRGGSIGFPSLHRDSGGFVPQVTQDDLAEIQNALAMATSGPVPQAVQAHGTAPQIHAPAPSQTPQGIDVNQLLGEMGTVSNVLKSGPSQPQASRHGGEVPRRAAGGMLSFIPSINQTNFSGIDPSMGPQGGTAATLGNLLGQPGYDVAAMSGNPSGVADAVESPTITTIIDPLGNLRRGGRAGFPSFATGGFPRAFATDGRVDGSDDEGAPGAPEEDSLSRALASPWAALMAAGAGMLASRSPFPGVALGEGLQSGLRFAAGQAQLKRQRANAPYVDKSGGTMKVVYPSGNVVPTPFGTDQTYQA